MGSKENHIRRIQEHFSGIEDAVDEGIENKPATIGLHCSACAVELLELFLHATHKIPVGKVIKHNWFKRPQEEQKKEPLAERKVGIDFHEKREFYELLYSIEENRNNLVYGNPSREQVQLVLDKFMQLKSKINIILLKEGINIEEK